jgi:hypothetical protein
MRLDCDIVILLQLCQLNSILVPQLSYMKPFVTFLLSFLVLTLFSNAQSRDFTQWLKKRTVEGKEITMLRVPELEFPSTILGHISEAQNMLKNLPNYYNARYTGRDIYKEIETYCQNIERNDPTFPVHYYRKEMNAFKELKIEMDQKVLAKKKADEEKEFFARLKSKFAWINRDSLSVRTKPDAKGTSIGKIHRLSYINAYEIEDQLDWVQIDFGDHNGYVQRKDIALTWEELALTREDSTHLLKGADFNFNPTAAYAAQLKKAAAEEERSLRVANVAPRRKYYSGPKGGCYFINSKGNKQYVDHSYCN